MYMYYNHAINYCIDSSTPWEEKAALSWRPLSFHSLRWPTFRCDASYVYVSWPCHCWRGERERERQREKQRKREREKWAERERERERERVYSKNPTLISPGNHNDHIVLTTLPTTGSDSVNLSPQDLEQQTKRRLTDKATTQVHSYAAKLTNN